MRDRANPPRPAVLAAVAGVSAALFACLCLCSASVLLVTYDVRTNDRELARLEDKIRELPQPAGTTAVAVRKQVGLLTGNGNHCDFFVGELRSFVGSAEKVQAHYAGQTLGDRTKIETIFVSGGEFVETDRSYLPEEFRNLADWTERADQGGLYVVFILDIGQYAGIDPRCH